MKVVFMNILYDITTEFGGDWNVIKDAVEADSRIGPSHMSPIHSSGRGAGGHCFIKDLAAIRLFCEEILPTHEETLVFLRAVESKNLSLLKETGKDLDLLEQVYGKVQK
jgi:UDP-glucose 6-dehydrogenase